MNAHQTNRYCERLLSMYKATNDHHARQTIDLEWRAAWADLLRQYMQSSLTNEGIKHFAKWANYAY